MLKENDRYYEDRYYEDEIDIRELFQIIWGKKTIILTVFISSIIICLLFLNIKYPIKKISKATTMLSFKGIEKHNYPNGTLFKKEDIITPYILSNVYNQLHNKYPKISLDVIREFLSIKEVIPGEIKKKIAEAEKKGKEYNYYSNKFELIFKQSNFYSNEISEKILRDIILQYVNYFKQNNIHQIYFSLLTKDILDKYDYHDIVYTMETKSNSALNFLKNTLKSTNKDKSAYLQIYDELNIFKEIDLKYISSLIETNKITKQKRLLIDNLAAEIEKVNLEKKIKEAKYIAAKNLMDNAFGKNSDKAETINDKNIILNKDFIDQQVKNSYRFFLIKKNLETHSNYKESVVQEEFLNKKLKMWKKIKKMNIKEKQSIDKKIKNLIIKFNDKMKRLNAINVEYINDEYSNSIKIIKPIENQILFYPKMKLITVVVGCTSIFISIFMIFFINFLKKENTEIIDDVITKKQQFV